MLVGWSVLASTGVFISSWMRPAFHKGRWFQLHRGLMITSVPTVLIGLICIFVSNKDNGVIIGFDCVSIFESLFSLDVFFFYDKLVMYNYQHQNLVSSVNMSRRSLCKSHFNNKLYQCTVGFSLDITNGSFCSWSDCYSTDADKRQSETIQCIPFIKVN